MAEPEWSGAHKGLCMYVARLLQPVWEEAVMAPLQGNAAVLSCRLPTATLQVTSFFSIVAVCLQWLCSRQLRPARPLKTFAS